MCMDVSKVTRGKWGRSLYNIYMNIDNWIVKFIGPDNSSPALKVSVV